MSDKRNGFLLVMMQPPPALEEEFNAWYDMEHVPERLAVPGFLSALRFVCLDGHPRYLAMYDLDAREVLDSGPYLAVSVDRFSPWTRRVTARVLVYRTCGVQIHPGAAATGRAARVRLLRFRGVSEADADGLVAALRCAFEPHPETVAVRVLACDGDDGHFGFVELRGPMSAPLDRGLLGRFADAIDLDNLYAPYDPRQ